MKAREPSGPIQLIPPGLLGLLQLKSPAGQNPHVLNNDVQPGIDILPFYLRSGRTLSTTFIDDTVTTNTGASNYFLDTGAVIASVPNDEYWWVESASLDTQCYPDNDEIVGLRLGYYYAGVQSWVPLGGENGSKPVGAGTGRILNMFTGNFWLAPGCSPAWLMQRGTFAAQQTITVRLVYTPLRL